MREFKKDALPSEQISKDNTKAGSVDISRREFFKKAAITGGILATGAVLTKLGIKEMGRENTIELENTHFDAGTITKKETVRQAPVVSADPLVFVEQPSIYFIYIKSGVNEGKISVSKEDYNSYTEGENLNVEYVTGKQPNEVKIKSFKKLK